MLCNNSCMLFYNEDSFQTIFFIVHLWHSEILLWFYHNSQNVRSWSAFNTPYRNVISLVDIVDNKVHNLKMPLLSSSFMWITFLLSMAASVQQIIGICGTCTSFPLSTGFFIKNKFRLFHELKFLKYPARRMLRLRRVASAAYFHTAAVRLSKEAVEKDTKSFSLMLMERD